MNDEQLKQALDNRPAPSVTIESIEERIKAIDFFVLPGTTATICN